MTSVQPPAAAQTDGIPDELLSALAGLIRDTRFGSIEIVVHDGRVTQIERREKLRLLPMR
jgi:hypothetical protein